MLHGRSSIHGAFIDKFYLIKSMTHYYISKNDELKYALKRLGIPECRIHNTSDRYDDHVKQPSEADLLWCWMHRRADGDFVCSPHWGENSLREYVGFCLTPRSMGPRVVRDIMNTAWALMEEERFFRRFDTMSTGVPSSDKRI